MVYKMKTKYYTLFKLTPIAHVVQDLPIKEMPGRKRKNFNKMNFILKNIINIFQDKKKLFSFCFNQGAELHLEEFFIIKYKTVVYLIVVGNMILIDNWNRKIQNLLENYIKKNGNFNDKNYFYFTDLTYWATNSEVKPRRLRSIGGSLRRILQDSKETEEETYSEEETYLAKETYSAQETIFSDVEFYAIIGNIDKLKMIFLAVKTNKKIPKLAELNTVISLQKQRRMYINEDHCNLKYRTVQFLYNFADTVDETNLDEKKLNTITSTINQLKENL